MIGLKRGTVKLVPHQKQWTALFGREKKSILSRTKGLVVDIEHIGSTAIPGILAKPIIDIEVGVRRLTGAKQLIKPLSKLGYRFHRISSTEIFFAKGPDSKRTHYLHVVRHNGKKWKNDLLFRDYLRKHPARARAYSRLKLQLAKRYAGERKQYTARKALFIKTINRLARKKGSQ